MANLQSDVPLVNAPIADPKTGMVTEAWFLFLIQLWRRTGSGGGDTPSGITIDDVYAAEQTFGVGLPAIDPNGVIAWEKTEAPGSRQEALLDMIFSPGSAAQIDIVDNTFTAGVDFNPGVDASLTLSRNFGAIPRLWIYFDGFFQGDDQVLSLVGPVLTFTAPIPVGVSKVYVKGLVLG